MKYFTNANKNLMPDYYQSLIDSGVLVVMPPKETIRHSVEQLEKMDMVGLYKVEENENES